MNPQIRVLLWVGLGFLLYLNFQAWMKAYPPAAPSRPAAESTAAAPPARPADGLSAELPTVSGEAAPAATTGAVPESTTQPVASSGKVRIRTDVLDVDASLAGAELVRADILQYPQHKDDPTTPVRLFNTDSPDTQFRFQSGLTTGEPGRSEPNHKAIFTSGAAEYRLADGADVLEVPFTWSDGAGLTVTKTFTFRRGAYRVDLRYRVENGGGGQARVLCAVPAPLARQRALDVGPGDLRVPRAGVLRR
jgi:YidC/Oxa1 family membrane protein insertase